jgi:hypothetical protein
MIATVITAAIDLSNLYVGYYAPRTDGPDAFFKLGSTGFINSGEKFTVNIAETNYVQILLASKEAFTKNRFAYNLSRDQFLKAFPAVDLDSINFDHG